MAFEVFARREDWSDSIAIQLGKFVGSNFDVALPVRWQTKEPGEASEPCLRLPVDVAQKLLDELWSLGLRPDQDRESTAGALQATQAHLKDMQALVQVLLPAALPQIRYTMKQAQPGQSSAKPANHDV